MKLSYSAHEKTMPFSSRALYQTKVNKNQSLCVKDVIILIESFIQAYLFDLHKMFLCLRCSVSIFMEKDTPSLTQTVSKCHICTPRAEP